MITNMVTNFRLLSIAIQIATQLFGIGWQTEVSGRDGFTKMLGRDCRYWLG